MAGGELLRPKERDPRQRNSSGLGEWIFPPGGKKVKIFLSLVYRGKELRERPPASGQKRNLP